MRNKLHNMTFGKKMCLTQGEHNVPGSFKPFEINGQMPACRQSKALSVNFNK